MQERDRTIDEQMESRGGQLFKETNETSLGTRKTEEETKEIVNRTGKTRDTKEGFAERGTYTVEGTLLARQIKGAARDAIYKDANTGTYMVDATVRDPYSKEYIELKGIRLSQMHTNEMQRVTSNSTVMVTASDARDIYLKNTANLSARLVGGDFKSANTAIPADLLSKSMRASQTAGGERKICNLSAAFDFKLESSTLFNKPNLTVSADSQNERSPGTLYDSATQESTYFHKDGHKMSQGQQGVQFNTPSINTGNAKMKRESIGTGGLPSRENDLRDIYPSSNILLNAPMVVPPYLPEFLAIIMGINMVYKLWRIGEVCSDAIKTGSVEETRKRQKARDEANARNVQGALTPKGVEQP